MLVPAMTIGRALIGKVALTFVRAEFIAGCDLTGAVSVAAFHRLALLL